VVNVDVGNLDRNLDIAEKYGVTLKVGALPALAVLDAGGKILARTIGGTFLAEADPAAYDVAKLAEFFTKPGAALRPMLNSVSAALQQAERRASRSSSGSRLPGEVECLGWAPGWRSTMSHRCSRRNSLR
jgi:hypothetical protein